MLLVPGLIELRDPMRLASSPAPEVPLPAPPPQPVISPPTPNVTHTSSLSVVPAFPGFLASQWN
jgi:hypothetical protein